MKKNQKKKKNKKKTSITTEEWVTLIFMAVCFAIVYGYIKPTFFD